MRDYEEWHKQYDDPESPMPWRLGVVRSFISRALDSADGPVRVLSLCAGDGRDVLGVLRERPDADRVHATLVEVLPVLTERAERDAAGLDVEVRCGDAGAVSTWADVVPVDLLLLVGIFGNISVEDTALTVRTAPALCRPGATVLWSRSREGADMTGDIRSWFTAAGCTELDFQTVEWGGKPSVGAVRCDQPSGSLAGVERLFTFTR